MTRNINKSNRIKPPKIIQLAKNKNIPITDMGLPIIPKSLKRNK